MYTVDNVHAALNEALAGFVAGSAATLIVHPLDLLKLRLQVDVSHSRHQPRSFTVAKNIVRNEGGLKALYRGIGPNLMGNSASWALYFTWYDMSKKIISSLHNDEQHQLSYYDYFSASSIAGILTALTTNPLWVIKTRMLSTSARHAGAYTSMTNGFRRVYLEEGLAGFYRGLVPSLFGVTHGALQFMAYEQMKKLRKSTKSNPHDTLNNYDFLLISATSKVFAGVITYPYQVIRSRLQIYNADELYHGPRDVVRKIWVREGTYGFYKGLGPNLLRIVPSTSVMFLVYENTRLLLYSPNTN